LREEGERQLVLFIAERRRDLLEKSGVATVGFDDVLDARRLALKPELRGGGEYALEPIRR
jgi:predicted RNase H-like nuclease